MKAYIIWAMAYNKSVYKSIKVAFLEGRLLSSQTDQIKKLSKSFDWLKKSAPPKSNFFFEHVNRLNESRAHLTCLHVQKNNVIKVNNVIIKTM